MVNTTYLLTYLLRPRGVLLRRPIGSGLGRGSHNHNEHGPEQACRGKTALRTDDILCQLLRSEHRLVLILAKLQLDVSGKKHVFFPVKRQERVICYLLTHDSRISTRGRVKLRGEWEVRL